MNEVFSFGLGQFGSSVMLTNIYNSTWIFFYNEERFNFEADLGITIGYYFNNDQGG